MRESAGKKIKGKLPGKFPEKIFFPSENAEQLSIEYVAEIFRFQLILVHPKHTSKEWNVLVNAKYYISSFFERL